MQNASVKRIVKLGLLALICCTSQFSLAGEALKPRYIEPLKPRYIEPLKPHYNNTRIAPTRSAQASATGRAVTPATPEQVAQIKRDIFKLQMDSIHQSGCRNGYYYGTRDSSCW